MQTAFDYAFHNYFEFKSVALKVMPWTTAQLTYNMKWYVPVRLPEPLITKDFSHEKITEPQYTELNNPTAAISLDLEVQDTDLKIAAQTTGMAIDSTWGRNSTRQKGRSHRRVSKTAEVLRFGDSLQRDGGATIAVPERVLGFSLVGRSSAP